MMTTSLVSQDPASVLILRSCLMGHVLQCLGRHLRLISVDVDPGSNNTLRKVRDLTVDMVSTTMILVGVSLFIWHFDCQRCCFDLGWILVFNQRISINAQVAVDTDAIYNIIV